MGNITTVKDAFRSLRGEVVASREYDYGGGSPYARIMRTRFLVRVGQRVYGKRYYLTEDGTSHTWLTDQKAELFMAAGDWVTWWSNKGDAHAIAIEPKARFELPKPDEEWKGVTWCGKDIPARGSYPPSSMSDRCQRCQRELKVASKH
jgi:hypothetical protein